MSERFRHLLNCPEDVPFFSFDGEIHPIKVTKCYDGDTLYCIFFHNNKYYRFKIRLLGYDSPEMKPSTKLPEDVRSKEKRAAKKAKKYLERMVMDRIVFLRCSEFDKYGRILGEILFEPGDTQSINEIMIQKGYGYPYYGGTKRKSVFSKKKGPFNPDEQQTQTPPAQ